MCSIGSFPKKNQSLFISDFPPVFFINRIDCISMPLSMGFSISYILSATMLAPCMASTSTPVLYTALTSTNTSFSKFLMAKSILQHSIGKGWQSGNRSAVFLTPKTPAARLMEKTSPLGTVPFSMARMVLVALTLTTACATAVRCVDFFCEISTISYVFTFHWYESSSKCSLPKTGTWDLISSTTCWRAAKAVFRCGEETKTKRQISPTRTLPKLW